MGNSNLDLKRKREQCIPSSNVVPPYIQLSNFSTQFIPLVLIQSSVRGPERNPSAVPRFRFNGRYIENARVIRICRMISGSRQELIS